MNIAIVGGRDFDDYKLLDKTVAKYIKEKCLRDVTVVSGGARGADTLAEQFADKYGYEKLIFLADWEGLGKSAGHKRNQKIVDNSKVVFAFWDGESKGTNSTIEMTQALCKELYIIKYKKKKKADKVMPFGKYKGTPLKKLIKVDANYCQWILDTFDHNSDIWEFMEKHKKTIAENYEVKVWDEDQENL